jgi:hypothetical protein
VDEIGKLVFLVQLAFDYGPSLEAGNGLIELGAREFSHASIIVCLAVGQQDRSHFHHIAQMFAAGNLNAPMLTPFTSS